MSRVLRYLIFTVLAALVLTIHGRAQQGAKAGEWRSYAGDNGGTRYAPYDLITRDNVKDLQVAWSWKFDNFGGGTSETTPIMANGVLYFTVGPRRNVVVPGYYRVPIWLNTMLPGLVDFALGRQRKSTEARR